MSRIERSALVRYSAEQMFALVNDVESYPQFLPWCAEASERERSADLVEGTLVVARGGVRQSFTTRNRLYPPERIDIQLVSGPFAELNGSWTFSPLRAGACKVQLNLEFQIASGVLQRVFAPFFEEIAESLVDAFVARARQLYGAPDD